MNVRSIVPLLVVCAIAGCSGGGGGGNSPDVFGVNSANVLIKFDLDSPNQVDSSTAITGLQVGETIVGMDFRPSNGVLYALGSTSRIYTINVNNGIATQVAAGAFTPLLSGASFGFDFSPSADVIRIVSDAEQNIRLSPATGLVIGVDVALAPAGDVVALAYDNNFLGAVQTSAFGIDATADTLVRIGGVNGSPSPNGGAVTTVGPLSVNVTSATSFDINADKTAVLVNNSASNWNDVYTVDLATGATTFLGTVTTGGNITAMAVRN